ncbi:hypothetical protein Misp01_31450 [Microtetraspora sp. NBRC 13810]|uniref:hypothetical protein n=1 Tax=Microtetraspora sp. NBRC 13810 TaxID=3030990 RepID=UPI0024A440A9|nr:hypothetical protein [Microtetraspora sp. NBRC 13810]GLW08015.1 hypothetical protein Misp01_31450 [Microtetraspora sp. NBRC 13810]
MKGWWARQREAQERRQLARLDDPRTLRWRDTRAKRQRLVVAGAGALALLWAGLVVIWFLAPSDTARNVYISMLFVAFAIGVFVVGVLQQATGGITTLSPGRLDERQLDERNRAYTTAHLATTAGLVVLVALSLQAGRTSGGLTITIPLALIYPGAFTLAVTHLFLPLLIVGWRLPDPPPDDEDD